MAAPARGVDDRDCRDGLFLRPLPYLRLVAAPLQNAERGNGDRRQNRNHADPAQIARRRSRILRRRVLFMRGHQGLRSRGRAVLASRLPLRPLALRMQ